MTTFTIDTDNKITALAELPAGAHTRERERHMRRFKSAVQAQRFLFLHGRIHNLFRVGRHHLRAVHHRLLRQRGFADWKTVTCAY